ncbi:hypothetical protein ABIB25_002696 [Nakamurella sp. UYEF19]|uniref:DinB family protein n=1 Tax=Nakamurella sp. UYEF19 TaxID=1756392 RepID=UPI003390809F
MNEHRREERVSSGANSDEACAKSHPAVGTTHDGPAADVVPDGAAPDASDVVPDVPVPDHKDWTWVLERPCPECDFLATAVERETIRERLLATTPRWQAVLARDEVAVRPAPQIWSSLEYGCHVRDVHTLFGERATLIAEHDDPGFANWDQDETALAGRYWASDPADVAADLDAACATAADFFSGLTDAQWRRGGHRSNGSVFTMETLGVYYLHDVVHHLSDVDG